MAETGLPGRPKEPGVWQPAKGEGFARFDGELPEANFPSSSSSFGEVRLPPPRLPGGDQGIGLAVGLQEGGAQGRRIVGDDAKVQALTAHAAQHRLDP